MTKYYKQKMDDFYDDDILPPVFSTPQFASAFTGWRYKEMRTVIEFCEKEDPNPPDKRIKAKLIADGLMRPEVGEPVNEKPNDHETNLIN